MSGSHNLVIVYILGLPVYAVLYCSTFTYFNVNLHKIESMLIAPLSIDRWHEKMANRRCYYTATLNSSCPRTGTIAVPFTWIRSPVRLNAIKFTRTPPKNNSTIKERKVYTFCQNILCNLCTSLSYQYFNPLTEEDELIRLVNIFHVIVYLFRNPLYYPFTLTFVIKMRYQIEIAKDQYTKIQFY